MPVFFIVEKRRTLMNLTHNFTKNLNACVICSLVWMSLKRKWTCCVKLSPNKISATLELAKSYQNLSLHPVINRRWKTNCLAEFDISKISSHYVSAIFTNWQLKCVYKNCLPLALMRFYCECKLRRVNYKIVREKCFHRGKYTAFLWGQTSKFEASEDFCEESASGIWHHLTSLDICENAFSIINLR